MKHCAFLNRVKGMKREKGIPSKDDPSKDYPKKKKTPGKFWKIYGAVFVIGAVIFFLLGWVL